MQRPETTKELVNKTVLTFACILLTNIILFVLTVNLIFEE
jgi:hypothetical protein